MRSLDVAEGALTLAAIDPARARAVTTAILDDSPDPETRTVALRALALAGKELGDLSAGIGHLREAVRAAEAAGLDHRAAQARMSLVGLLAASGDSRTALAVADTAAPVLRGVDAARLLANRACALSRGGRMDEALATCQRAVSQLQAYDDKLFLAGTLLNAALIRLYRGERQPAENGLARALAIASQAGYRHLALMARDGMAFAALRSGDLPRALALYDEIEPALGEAAERVGQVRLGRAQALLAARLPREARTVLAAALGPMSDRGYAADHAEGRLLLAESELACAELGDGVPETAAGIAEQVHRDCERQGRPGWALLAEHVTVRARWAARERSDALLRRARTVADRLSRAGWTVAAADSRITAGRLALELDRPALARQLLAEVDGATDHSPLAVRVAGWHARALERLSHGDHHGAADAVGAGLDAVERHAALLGATELRAHAGGWGTQLAALGLRMAVDSHRPATLLAWAERARVVTFRPAPVRPPADAGLAAALSELRHVCDRLTAALGDGADPGPWLAARLRLEASVRARARCVPAVPAENANPGASAPATGVPSGAGAAAATGVLDELYAALNDRAFVELVRLDDALLAVSVAQGRCQLWNLGSYGAAVRRCRTTRFEAHRQARRGDGGEPDRGFAAAAAGLDAQLLAPIREVLGDRELVLAPTGRLYGVPWSAVPSLSGRPVSVVPSARAWLRARADAGAARTARGRTVLVAGPGLAHAEPEITALHALYPEATVLTGTAARASAVRTALRGAGLAHLATHGDFRADNPLFSSLRLTDGPLMAYDVETLDEPPRVVVLAACDAGRAEVHAGDAVMGLAAALLGFGTTTVVASVTPVGDAATRQLMRGFHERLVTGIPPAQALAEAPRAPGSAGFVCFGAG